MSMITEPADKRCIVTIAMRAMSDDCRSFEWEPGHLFFYSRDRDLRNLHKAAA